LADPLQVGKPEWERLLSPVVGCNLSRGGSSRLDCDYRRIVTNERHRFGILTDDDEEG
jgi:hypothetical protein